MDDNCGEWVECMDVVSRRWVWLVGVGGIYGCGCKVIPTPLVSVLFYSSIPSFFLNVFRSCYMVVYLLIPRTITNYHSPLQRLYNYSYNC